MSKGQIRTFLSRERSRLISYARSILWDADVDAEDVVHDVLLKLLERSDSPAPEFLAAYTYRSLRNRVTDIARTSKDHVSINADNDSLLEILQDKSPTAMDELATAQGQQELFAALDILTETERQVVIANELEGQTFKSLSAAWDMPLNTLLSHKSRAMKKLRKQLTGRSL